MNKEKNVAQGLVYASREEIQNEPLVVMEGKIPDDISGCVYFSAPVGTIKSGGLPYPAEGKHQWDYGAPVFNGDGMIIGIDFSASEQAILRTGIMRTPCFYADEEMTHNAKEHNWFNRFFNAGISRMSLEYGTRNQLNTALLPYRQDGDTNDRILACFDVGRPQAFDPLNFNLQNPVGQNLDWAIQFKEIPMVGDYVFPMIQTTAHPSFDPYTKEFFAVNFTENIFNLLFPKKLLDHLKERDSLFFWKLFKYFYGLLEDGDKLRDDASLKELQKIAEDRIEEVEQPNLLGSSRERLLKELLDFLDRQIPDEEIVGEEVDLDGLSWPKDAVFVVKRDGQNRIKRWEVVDEEGNPISVKESLHQTGITKDYFVFIDTAFKISAEILVHKPLLGYNLINTYLRKLLHSKVKDYTYFYIIKRSDLTIEDSDDFSAIGKVHAQKLRIDESTVHFAIDYDNPADKITIHCAHNSSLCAAEWIRTFDKMKISRSEPEENLIGLPTIGEMDVSKIGKLTIDVPALSENKNGLVEHKLLEVPLKLEDVKKGKYGLNTWGIGLFTHNNYLSPTLAEGTVKDLYWQFYGLDERFLPKYIYDLYDQEASYTIEPKELLEYTKAGIPFSIARQDVATMQFTDGFIFEKDVHFRSLQFVPKVSSPSNGTYEDEGYLVCTLIVPNTAAGAGNYQREIWIFDTLDLAKGPVCKLTHEKLSYAFTIHSAWLPNPESQPEYFDYSVRADFNALIDSFHSKKKGERVREFMEEYIYPKFS